MAYEFNGTSQYLSTTSSPLSSGEVITLACWFYATRDSPYEAPFSLGDSTTDSKYCLLQRYKAASTDQLYFMNANVTEKSAISTNAVPKDSWTAAGGVSSSANSRAVFLNGSKNTNSDSSTNVTTLNRIAIGALIRNAAGGYLAGKAAEAAIWSVALSDDEMTSLSKGFKPQRVRPQSLVFYAPLIRNLMDRKGGLTITNNNSATVADHPRVY